MQVQRKFLQFFAIFVIYAGHKVATYYSAYLVNNKQTNSTVKRSRPTGIEKSVQVSDFLLRKVSEKKSSSQVKSSKVKS